ncbi:HAD family phosphatase [Corynebacterium frankenforstense]|uniref:HAD family hydrolase n=1 Tax=Corynebacterium frankenforstense TaxID=1230998 RepID=UPI0026ECA4CB|nr:HAD family phosphatase [Corynebacterium frankenforstense]
MSHPTLLFDMYGVLMRLPGPSFRRGVLVAAGGNEDIWPVYAELRPALDAAQVTEVNYWRQVALRAGVEDLDIQEAIAADYGDCLEADHEVVDNVLALRDKGYKVGILSNIPTGLAARVRRRHSGWLDEFDAVTFSCDIEVAKPDTQAFAVAVDALGASPRDTVFFDDREDYIAGAEAAGLRAVLFTGWDSVAGELGLK